MKKLILAAGLFMALQSCGNGGEGGAVDDGMRPADSNGALPDDTAQMNNGRIDTSAKGKNRVGIKRRDSKISNGGQ